MPHAVDRADAIVKVNLVLSLLRCADDALLSGDDCHDDIIATHIVVAKMLMEIKQSIV